MLDNFTMTVLLIPFAEWKTKGICFHRVPVLWGGTGGGRDNE